MHLGHALLGEGHQLPDGMHMVARWSHCDEGHFYYPWLDISGKLALVFRWAATYPEVHNPFHRITVST